MTSFEAWWLVTAMTILTVSSQIPEKFSIPQLLPPDHSFAHPDFTSFDPSGPLPDLNMVIVHNSSLSTPTPPVKESPITIISTPVSNDIFEVDPIEPKLNVPLAIIGADNSRQSFQTPTYESVTTKSPENSSFLWVPEVQTQTVSTQATAYFTGTTKVETATTTEKTTDASSSDVVVIPNIPTLAFNTVGSFKVPKSDMVILLPLKGDEQDLRNSKENVDILKSSKYNTKSTLEDKKINEQTSIHNLDGINPSLPPFAFAEDANTNKVAEKEVKVVPDHPNNVTPTLLSLLPISDKPGDNSKVEENTESIVPIHLSLNSEPFAVAKWRRTEHLNSGITGTNFATSTGKSKNHKFAVSSEKILKRIDVETVPVGSLNIDNIHDANIQRSTNSKSENNKGSVNNMVNQVATMRTDDFLVAMVSTTEHSPATVNRILDTSSLHLQQENYEPQANFRKSFPRGNQKGLTENILGNPISEFTTQNNFGLRTTIKPSTLTHGNSSPQKSSHNTGASQALPIAEDRKQGKSDSGDKKRGSGYFTLKKLIRIRKLKKGTQQANQLAAKTKPVRSIQSFDLIDGNTLSRSQANLVQNLRGNLQTQQLPLIQQTTQNRYSLLPRVQQQIVQQAPLGQEPLISSLPRLNLQRASIPYRQQLVNPQANIPLLQSAQRFNSQTVPSSFNSAIQNVQLTSNSIPVALRNVVPTSQNYFQNIYSLTRTLTPPTQSIRTANLAEEIEKISHPFLKDVNRAVVYDRLRTIRADNIGLQKISIHSNRRARILSAGKTASDVEAETIQENNPQNHHTHEGEVRTN